MTIIAQQIEIIDYETQIVGERQNLKEKESGRHRWQFSFPFFITYAIGNEELVRPLNCDFADVCSWAFSKNIIEDFSLEEKDGWVLIAGSSDVKWSPQIQDAIETFTGRYFMTFTEFLREFLTEKDIIEFVTYWINK